MKRSVAQSEVPNIEETPRHKPRLPLASRCAATACALGLLLSSCAQGIALIPLVIPTAASVPNLLRLPQTSKPYEPHYIEGASRDPVAPGQLGSATSDAAEVTIRALIVPNGPGSWTKDATWYKVAFVLRNLSKDDTEVTGIRAVNQQGVFVNQVGAGRPSYPPMPTVPGVSCMGGKAWPAASTSMQQWQAQVEDCGKISAEYQSRQVQRATLAAGGSLVASAFFPLSSGAIREVVFSIVQGGRRVGNDSAWIAGAAGFSGVEGGKVGELRVKLSTPAAAVSN